MKTWMEKGLKVYSLVGKKLVECEPDELKDKPVGMIVDEKEEMIRRNTHGDNSRFQYERICWNILSITFRKS